jgi:hypothetical protein
MNSPDLSPEELEGPTSRACGHTYLLAAAAEKLGLAEILRSVFPWAHAPLMAIAQYLALNQLPLSRLGAWAGGNETGLPPESFTPDALMELFRGLRHADVERFRAAWKKRWQEASACAYDTTCLSERSASQLRSATGELRKADSLNVLDFCAVFGKKSLVPFDFRLYHGRPGNLRDLAAFLQKFHGYSLKNITFVLGDRYYSQDSIDALFGDLRDSRFLLRVRGGARGVFDALREKFTKDLERELSPKRDKFVYTEKIKIENERVLVHVFKNRMDRIAAANAAGYNLRDMLFSALENPALYSTDENSRARLSFFHNPLFPSGFSVDKKIGVQASAPADVGWSIYLSGGQRQTDKACELTEKFAIIERVFSNINNFSDLYNFPFSIMQGASGEVSKLIRGKMFAGFLSLVLLACADATMYSKSLYGAYTLDELFDELSLIRVARSGEDIFVTKCTDRQKLIYSAFGVPEPDKNNIAPRWSPPGRPSPLP